MSRLSAVKKTYAMSRRLKSQRGGSLLWYFLDAVYCGYKHGASPENYFVLRFYEQSEKQRAEFLTSGRSKAVDAQLNRNAAAEEKRIIGSKALFDKAFAGLVKREFLYVPEHSFAQFQNFLQRHNEFIVKPTGGTMGQGIEKLSRDGLDEREMYERWKAGRMLLEEPIKQHPALAGINPSCVNTVRINAARDCDGNVRLIGACLKCGGAGAVTDNFHTGGIAYPLDLESGRVTGPGRSNMDIKDYEKHPGTEAYMPGFQLPYWQDVKDCVRQGMDRVPSLGYVGWDVSVTPDGPELIEGNYHWPGGNIIQFDGVGKYPLILNCLVRGWRNEEHID